MNDRELEQQYHEVEGSLGFCPECGDGLVKCTLNIDLVCVNHGQFVVVFVDGGYAACWKPKAETS